MVTCNNASNNDVMIDRLSVLAPEFAGKAAHTQCFLHIMNLISKTLIRQFDIKKGAIEGDEDMSKLGANELHWSTHNESDYNTDADANNVEGWLDERDDLTEAEQLTIEQSMWPIWLALVKVSE